ncbi:MAG: glycosyltransferase 61 family protein [Salegentibacter mishustinae]|nr:glycosyltransferase 61 family protein [Salegentibacter mishustinae]
MIDSNNNKNKIYLKFYKNIGTGTDVNKPDHFFHFIWGYFLPSLNWILSNESSARENRENKIYYLRSCGPLMDKIFDEIFPLFDINYQIQKEKTLDQSDLPKIFIPRWDVILNIKWQYILNRKTRWRFNIWFKRFWDNISFSNRHYILRTRKFKKEFFQKINDTENAILSKIGTFPPNPYLDKYIDQYVILKRSEEPDHYKKGVGEAEEKTYGTGRRALTGIEEASKILMKKGTPVQIFEPGICSLRDQINVFRRCKGIIFIKGAECTLMNWMKPGSKVIMIWPESIDYLPLQRNMAKFFNLEYHEIVTGPNLYPKLEPDVIYKLIAPH